MKGWRDAGSKKKEGGEIQGRVERHRRDGDGRESGGEVRRWKKGRGKGVDRNRIERGQLDKRGKRAEIQGNGKWVKKESHKTPRKREVCRAEIHN